MASSHNTERSELSDAYDFLRTLEHRLQMEHGLQTHTVPEAAVARALIGRRMGYTAREFEAALELHKSHVRRTYDRLFSEVVLPASLARNSQPRQERR